MTHLRKLCSLYRDHSLCFWTGFSSTFFALLATVTVMGFVFSAIFESNVESVEQILDFEATLGFLSLSLPVAIVSGSLGVALSYACRYVQVSSSTKWLWLTFVVAQLGIIVAVKGLAFTGISSLNQLASHLLWLPDADGIALGCSFGIGFWLLEIAVIYLLKAVENIVNRACPRTLV